MNSALPTQNPFEDPEVEAGPAKIVELSAVDLAAFLNSRLCHDLISPTSALTSALDLLEDPDAEDMRDDALALIKSSVEQLSSKLSFARVAFGAASTSHNFPADDLKPLVETAFAKSKAEVKWQMENLQFSKPAGRAMINLAIIAAECLPRGGEATFVATEEDDGYRVHITATGRRAKLRKETGSGLRSEEAPTGLVGLWVQPYYTHALIASIGGTVEAASEDEVVTLKAFLPKEEETTLGG